MFKGVFYAVLGIVGTLVSIIVFAGASLKYVVEYASVNIFRIIKLMFLFAILQIAWTIFTEPEALVQGIKVIFSAVPDVNVTMLGKYLIGGIGVGAFIVGVILGGIYAGRKYVGRS